MIDYNHRKKWNLMSQQDRAQRTDPDLEVGQNNVPFDHILFRVLELQPANFLLIFDLPICSRGKLILANSEFENVGLLETETERCFQ